MSEIENKKKVKASHIKTSFVALTILFFLTLTGFGWVLNDLSEQSKKTKKLADTTATLSKRTAHLTKENSKRISEIQASRISSCKTTYLSYPLVFKPFLPKKPYTPQDKILLKKFRSRVAYLVHRCEIQTKPKKVKKINKATQ